MHNTKELESQLVGELITMIESMLDDIEDVGSYDGGISLATQRKAEALIQKAKDYNAKGTV